jgi:hypothetical protein
MELCWLGAWGVFTSAALLQRPFPLLEATAALAAASLLTRLLSGRGWLVVAVLGFQTIGLLAAVGAVLRGLYRPASPLLDSAWLAEMFRPEWGGQDWLLFLLGFLAAAAFWREGVRVARRPLDDDHLFWRLDVGLGAFFLLFLIKLVAAEKGAQLDDPVSQLFVLPFVVSSLVAIGMNRLAGDGQKGFLPGFRGAAVFLTFTAAALLPVAAAALLALPYLRLAAQGGLYVLTRAGLAVSPYLLAILGFLFAPRSGRPGMATPPPQPRAPALPSGEPAGWWMELLGAIAAWGVGILLALAVTAVVGLALALLLRFLVSRTAGGPARRTDRPGPRVWLTRLRRLLAGLPARWRSPRRAGEVYGRLLAWARRSGVRHRPSETPAEFGARLAQRFPRLLDEVGRIVHAFNAEAYGDRAGPATPAALIAWRRVRSPRHWPARLRGWWRA